METTSCPSKGVIKPDEQLQKILNINQGNKQSCFFKFEKIKNLETTEIKNKGLETTFDTCFYDHSVFMLQAFPLGPCVTCRQPIQ